MKLRYLLSALAGAALLASCVEEEPVASYDLAIKLDKSVVAVGSEGGSATVEVNSGEISWAATCSADWVEFSPASGKGNTKVTVTVGASDEDRTAEITLKADNLEKLITVIQTGNPHGLTEDDPLNIKEAVEICLKLADKAKTGKKYYVKGIISSIVEGFKDTGDYGNATFWLSDNGETKDFEVYRTLYFDNTKYGEYTGADKPDVGEGDEVVIYGLIMNYGGTAETSANESYLYSLKSNTEPAISCKEASKIVGASETEAKFVIAPKNLTEGWTVTTDANWITEYTQSGAKDATEIVVKFAANTDPAPREATFTVKSAGAKDLVLTLKQGGFTASGTLDKPYTVAEVIAAIKDGSAAGNVYVKGIISKEVYTYSSSYNTGTFWISDDGVYNEDLNKDFEAYSVFWVGGSLEAPVAAADIKCNYAVGDEVVLYGAVTAYTKNDVTTYETSSKKAKVYSINWATTEENGVGNVDYPFNIAGAKKFIDDTQAAIAAAKAAGEELAIPDVAVKGKVNELVGTGFDAAYGNGTFWISDDGSAKDFEAYRVMYLENKAFEEGMTNVAVGDEVILKGQLTKYGETYETSSKKAYLYSLNGQTEAQPAPPALFLNEFDTLNKKIEIYNSTDAEVDMTGWTLSKDETVWEIPAEHAKVPAKGYIVYTGKSDGTTNPTFGLSGTKGFVVVLKKGDTVVDQVDNSSAREGGIVAIEDGKSWGRETDGAANFVIFDEPTIGMANGPEKWDYTPGSAYADEGNLWKAAAGNEKFYYYHCTSAEWNGKDTEAATAADVPFLKVKESTFRLKYEEATGADWQNQFMIRPTEGHYVALAADKKYSFKVTLAATANMNGFFKLTQYDAADASGVGKHEGACIWEWGRKALTANTPVVLESPEITGVECENINLVFDFGANPAFAVVYIKDITLVEIPAEVPPAEPAKVGDILWSETWTGGAKDASVDAYTQTGTTVFGGGKVTYSAVKPDNGSAIKIYIDNQMDGATEQENLLLSKNGGTWTISGIPTGQATKAELSIKVNAKREPDLTTTTTGVTIGERKLGEETAKPYTYTWEISFAEVETFDLTFTLTNSSNLRIDDVKLVVTEAGGASSSDNGSGIPDYDPITGFTW